MARTAQYNPSVEKIRWKPSHKNCSSLIHGKVQRKERREITIRFFTSHSKGTSWGYSVTLEVIYDLDPRNKMRAWLNAGQLRLLPDFIKSRLKKSGIDVSTTRPRFPLYRVAIALWGADLDSQTDVHHLNNNCLDDRFNNLQPLAKDEHALHHMIEDNDVETNDSEGIGFFDYRKFSELKEQRSKSFAKENADRKILDLEPIAKTSSSSGWHETYCKFLHRQLRQKLLGW